MIGSEGYRARIRVARSTPFRPSGMITSVSSRSIPAVASRSSALRARSATSTPKPMAVNICVVTSATWGLSSTSRIRPLTPAECDLLSSPCVAGTGLCDRRTVAWHTVHADRTARLLRETIDLAEAQAGSLARLLGGEERIEHLTDH